MIKQEETIYRVIASSINDAYREARDFAASCPHQWTYLMPKREHLGSNQYALRLIQCNPATWPRFAPNATLLYAGELELPITLEGLCSNCKKAMTIQSAQLTTAIPCECRQDMYGYQFVLNWIYSKLISDNYHLNVDIDMCVCSLPYPAIRFSHDDAHKFIQHHSLALWRDTNSGPFTLLEIPLRFTLNSNEQCIHHIVKVAIIELYKAIAE